jgi:hypothetical protein
VPALIVTEGGPAPYATMFLVTALIVYLQYRIVKRWRHAFVV